MNSLKIRRIHHAAADAATQLTDLVRQLSLQAEVVSPRGRKLTEKVFGQALTPVQVVERICQDVRTRGLEAVLHYTEQFDQAKLTRATIRIDEAELERAHAKADPEFLATLRRVRLNVLSFQMGLVQSDAVLTVTGKHELRLRYRPMRRVGICVPGGAAAYPSTLLMTVCPAQAAGVKEIVVVLPPTPNGAGNRDLLATCHELGVSEVYRIGGAQAVAALAYGVDNLPAVDMIVGPGNIFVTLAKKYVFGQVAIDCLAGPSEVVVLADDSARPDYVAADLLAQAEHDPATSILITWHEPLLDEVQQALERQLPKLPRGELARSVWRSSAPWCWPETRNRPPPGPTASARSICTSPRTSRPCSPSKSTTPGPFSWASTRRSPWEITLPAHRTSCRPAARPASPAACAPPTSCAAPASCPLRFRGWRTRPGTCASWPRRRA